MSFEFYVDVRVIESADTVDLSLPTIRNQIYAVLHGTFRALALVDKSPYAIALVASPKLKQSKRILKKNMASRPVLILIFFGYFRIVARHYSDW